MVCGDLLGLGAIGYSEYAATAIASNLTLADTKLFSASSVGGYYFTGKYTIVVQMSGTTSIKYDCGTKMGCDPYLHVAPLISGTDVDTFLQNRTSVKLWVAMTSSESDPLKVFPKNGTFDNGAISLTAKPEDATSMFHLSKLTLFRSKNKRVRKYHLWRVGKCSCFAYRRRTTGHCNVISVNDCWVHHNSSTGCSYHCFRIFHMLGTLHKLGIQPSSYITRNCKINWFCNTSNYIVNLVLHFFTQRAHKTATMVKKPTTTKRFTLNKKYKIFRKIKDHKKKIRKHAGQGHGKPSMLYNLILTQ
jgi:hypothetical protein